MLTGKNTEIIAGFQSQNQAHLLVFLESLGIKRQHTRTAFDNRVT